VGLKSVFPLPLATVNAKHVELVDNHKLIEELRRLKGAEAGVARTASIIHRG
jgi:hypothetical protein